MIKLVLLLLLTNGELRLLENKQGYETFEACQTQRVALAQQAITVLSQKGMAIKDYQSACLKASDVKELTTAIEDLNDVSTEELNEPSI